MDMKKWKYLVIIVVVLAVGAIAIGLGTQQSNPEEKMQASSQENRTDTEQLQGDNAEQQPAVPEEESKVPTVYTEEDGTTTILLPNDGNEEIKVQIGVEESGDILDDLEEEEYYQTGSNQTGNQTTEPPANPAPNPNNTPDDGKEPTVAPMTPGQIGPNLDTTYEEYLAMSTEEQMRFYYSFACAEDFYEWYNAAKAEYEANSGDIVVGNGPIDMEQIFGSND